jgi:hypothetical protein
VRRNVVVGLQRSGGRGYGRWVFLVAGRYTYTHFFHPNVATHTSHFFF